MRFGIISSSYPSTPTDSSNAGVFVRDFALELTRRGHEVVVVTPQRAEAGEDPFPVISFPWPGDETSLTHIDPRAVRNMSRLGMLLASGTWTCLAEFRRRRIDHVVAMWALPSGLLALAARTVLRVPYSVWALGSDIWRADDYPGGRRALRQIIGRAAHVYADGLRLAADVEEAGGRPCAFLPTSRKLPVVPAAAVDLARPTYLCVARFHPHKGIDVLVDAVGLLPADVRSTLRVAIFGAGPDESKLLDRVSELRLAETVQIGGLLSRDRLAGLLRAARCLIIPSRLESIPLILSDAAQAGCPVVVTETGDMGALVRRFRAGEVVDAGSPEGLAAGLLRFHHGDSSWAPEGLHQLADHLSIDQSVARVVEDASAGRPASRSGFRRSKVR